ncbi:maleylpyruvate isomerase N-terminal domain-containing protein [Streptomyces sp. SHP 1-2]|uniref:maleylpyruvate isomerase N-terminal domain-containing protein n=1 Tax=Streptomyces sp. SHP 1-2 TaxID=2769489 RepID=UPI002237DED9|nr:maleylpyruvate isomerase N-terminal domain-containing protein [Streptomyces sp. SHP 1-2]MCW5254407.1 maleylpyruvate isomerase family mycothiol-dependent enzyme [Streptomyces sp. SHP 1-2]
MTTPLEFDRYCDEIPRGLGELRSAVTSGTALSTTVPTCPEWTLEDLALHTGRALRWAGHLVRTRATEHVPVDAVPGSTAPAVPGDAGALDAWLAEAGARLVEALREAGPDAAVWSWAAVHRADFWARRMTHELVVHGADAVLAAGRPLPGVPADVAADAIDEWLEILRFTQRALPDGRERELRGGPGRTLHLHATDAPPELDAEWLVELTEDGIVWRRGHEKAAVALRGPLDAVLFAFYRRLSPDAPELEVLGERELLDFWLERASFG